jgi:3-methylfumaryl-CoA hydratase
VTQHADDMVSDRLVGEFNATLSPWLFALPGGDAPLGLHWCLAPPLADTLRLGPDGHPPRRHAVSAQDFPRRMWVGGSIDLMAPLRHGQQVRRTSTLAPLEFKEGRSGRWCLTGAEHRFEADGFLLLYERQDIAFRPGAAAASAVTAAGAPVPAGDLQWEIAMSSALLFRYSALTFNGHRIHYDHPYATGVEGYSGLVVHGPLQATVLLNLAATLLGRAPAHFSYRATAPLIAGTHMIAVGRMGDAGVSTSMHAPDGTETMRAVAH